jgi:hypothetical protein
MLLHTNNRSVVKLLRSGQEDSNQIRLNLLVPNGSSHFTGVAASQYTEQLGA